MNKYELKSKVWLYPGMAGWHFIGVDKKTSKALKEKYGQGRPGFGSIPVNVEIGESKWQTSIFPDKQSGTYLLPVKASVRKNEGVFEGDMIKFTLAIDQVRLKQ